MDRVRGILAFGDGRQGLIPPIAKDNLVCREFVTGGGEAANQASAPLAVKELRTSLPFVDKVFNVASGSGGAAAWSRDDTLRLGPQTIKNRGRAVTTEDYEWMIRERFGQIAKVRCLPTRAVDNGQLVFQPGAVTIIVRVPPEHEQEFLDLLIDPPTPVTVRVSFTVTFAVPPTQSNIIPAGTRVATAFSEGRRFVFETVEDATIEVPDPLGPTPNESMVTVTAREYLVVTDEVLGTSTGVPRETFQLSPVLSNFGLEPTHPAPLLVDYVHRSEAYDPNPRIRVLRGFVNGIGGAVSIATGFLEVRSDDTPRDTHYFVTFAPPSLTLTRGDGANETVSVAALPIPVGQTETVHFPGFQVRITLSAAFDKSTTVAQAASTATITGTGTIDAGSIRIVAVEGSVAGITSDVLAIDSGTPSATQVQLADGFTGTFDASTAGPKQIVLRDAHANTLTIELNVTTPFDGNETATVEVGPLANLIAFVGDSKAQHSLLTEQSRVGPLNPTPPRHVRVDPIRRTIQFGDGVFGALPVPGAEVVCTHYQLLQGPDALIEANEIQRLLTPIPGLDSVEVRNDADASGGTNFFKQEERLAAGLEGFRKPYRLVTAADFERVLLDDFNEYQELAGRPERIARATAIMNRRPPLVDDAEALGHVTVMVLRSLNEPDQAVFDDLVTSVAAKESMLAGVDDDPLTRRILEFLDRRRLITTRPHVVAPSLVGVSIDVRFVIDGHRNTTAMEQSVRDKLLKYLSLLDGGSDQRGWRPGRNVYRSEVFRLVEGAEGVDHVDVLTMAPANADGDISIGPHALPVIAALNATALRT